MTPRPPCRARPLPSPHASPSTARPSRFESSAYQARCTRRAARRPWYGPSSTPCAAAPDEATSSTSRRSDRASPARSARTGRPRGGGGARVIEARRPADRREPGLPGSFTGLFKHLFDFVGQYALVGTPVLVAATGGGERHALILEHQLRPLFGFFQALTLPIGVYASIRLRGLRPRPLPTSARISQSVDARCR